MKQQIIFLEGGIAKENYQDYMEYLQQLEYNPYEEKRKKWKHSLEEDLGENYEVLFLPFGNRDFAYYPEWKVVFEKVFPYLQDNAIFIGHSLGGSFLVKYFNELPLSSGHLLQGRRLIDKVKKIFLLAPAFKDDPKEMIGSFNFDQKLETLQKYSEKITILHSKDDFLVPYEDFEDFQKVIPEAEYISFEDKNHFLDENFPEFVKMIKNI